MKYCPNPDCPGKPSPGEHPEFTDEVLTCPDCGMALVYASLPAEAEGANPSPEEADAEDDGTPDADRSIRVLADARISAFRQSP